MIAANTKSTIETNPLSCDFRTCRLILEKDIKAGEAIIDPIIHNDLDYLWVMLWGSGAYDISVGLSTSYEPRKIIVIGEARIIVDKPIVMQPIFINHMPYYNVMLRCIESGNLTVETFVASNNEEFNKRHKVESFTPFVDKTIKWA